MVMQILGCFAEFERAMIRERTRVTARPLPEDGPFRPEERFLRRRALRGAPLDDLEVTRADPAIGVWGETTSIARGSLKGGWAAVKRAVALSWTKAGGRLSRRSLDTPEKRGVHAKR
jgi:hypothetical protein